MGIDSELGRDLSRPPTRGALISSTKRKPGKWRNEASLWSATSDGAGKPSIQDHTRLESAKCQKQTIALGRSLYLSRNGGSSLDPAQLGARLIENDPSPLQGKARHDRGYDHVGPGCFVSAESGIMIGQNPTPGATLLQATHTFTSMPVVYITVIPSAIPPMAVGDARDHTLPPAVRTI